MNVQSIKDKLKNVARENNRIYQEVLTVYALERTIFRISVSKYKENFTLKGGIFLYALYKSDYPRSTTDIDLRADKISGNKENLIGIFSEIFKISVADGLVYDFNSLFAKEITKQDEYQGLNISVVALLGNVRIPVSIDIGFGDVVVPSKLEIDFPVLLEMPVPKIYSYSVESMLAEKFEAIVSLGFANTRFKDFYDIFVILKKSKIKVNQSDLKEALIQTFKNRNTGFNDIVAFEEDFALDSERQKRWSSFVKNKKALVQSSFDEVSKFIKSYFEPIVEEVKNKN